MHRVRGTLIHGSGASTWFRLALVGIGAAMVFASTLQYQKRVATLRPQDCPRPHRGGALILASSLAIVGVGLALGADLLLTSG